MSSMSSAQIVSATAMHNKAAAVGLSLGLGTPAPYTGAVSLSCQIEISNLCPSNKFLKFVFCFDF